MWALIHGLAIDQKKRSEKCKKQRANKPCMRHLFVVKCAWNMVRDSAAQPVMAILRNLKRTQAGHNQRQHHVCRLVVHISGGSFRSFSDVRASLCEMFEIY